MLNHLQARCMSASPVASVIAKAPVLSKIVRAGESVATAVASERLVTSVERAIVTFQMFLTMEAPGTHRANESFSKVMVFDVLVPGTAAVMSSSVGNFLVGGVPLRIAWWWRSVV
jgi:hypothetical protein